MRRAGDEAGAGGMGPLTTADAVPVTGGAVPTPWPLCRRLVAREGLSGPIPRPRPRHPPGHGMRVHESCGLDAKSQQIVLGGDELRGNTWGHREEGIRDRAVVGDSRNLVLVTELAADPHPAVEGPRREAW